MIAGLLPTSSPIRIDVIRGDVFLDGVASNSENQANQQLLTQLSALGIDSIHILRRRAARRAAGRRRVPVAVHASPASRWLRNSRRATFSTSASADCCRSTRAGARSSGPDAPTGPLDPDYAESLLMAQQTWEDTAAGKPLDVVTVRDLVQLLIYKVARSNAALGQILAVKQYQNLTYCHSVNVAMLSLLLGKQVGLDEAGLAALVEAALLHDVGQDADSARHRAKPGALDKAERAR